jgi:hypothetical protein
MKISKASAREGYFERCFASHLLRVFIARSFRAHIARNTTTNNNCNN